MNSLLRWYLGRVLQFRSKTDGIVRIAGVVLFPWGLKCLGVKLYRESEALEPRLAHGCRSLSRFL